MHSKLALALLSLALLAGCATPGGDGPGDATPPPSMTNAEAQALLMGAVEDMPDRVGFLMTLTSGGQTLMTFDGSFDNTTGRTYFRLTGDAQAIAAVSGGSDAQDPEDIEQMAALFGSGLEIYATRAGSVMLANGTAYVFPGNESSAPVDTGEFGEFTDSEEILSPFAGDDVTITSVTPTVYRGKAAVQIVAVGHEDDENVTATITVFTSPRRVAAIESTIPADEMEGSPFSNGTLKGDFYYDDEVTARAPSEAVTRAMGLGYSSGGMFGGSSGEITWTFFGDEGIATSEVEVHVKNASDGNEMGSMPSFADAPNAWTMKLSEGTKTQDGVTITFTDADGDNKVSPGDTLQAAGPEDGILPTIVLYDVETGTYVMPGAPLVLLLAGLAVVAIVLRRR